MNFQAILFDLDGTLLDTLDDLADASNGALAELGLPVHPAASYKYFVGDGIETLAARTLPEDRGDPATLARLTDLIRRNYAAGWAVKTCPYPGIAELLDAVTARHIPMAVLSNKPHEFTRLCVEKLLARWRFDIVQGATSAIPKKPDPGGAAAIARQLGVAPQQVLYLGDTDTDMRTAVAAEMVPVGVLWGFRTLDELLAHGALATVRTPAEVLELLDRESPS
jgi:phosphoglycolate phosphatase